MAGGAEREALRAGLAAFGFDEVRFARAGVVPAAARAGLAAWLAAGQHAEMAWMERSVERRGDPGAVVAGARTIVACGMNYLGVEPPAAGAFGGEAGGAEFARYARMDDYHDTLGPALRAAGRWLEQRYGLRPEEHREYTDTGPVLERGWAARAGLGFLGKNGMLISPRHGNWLLLGVMIVTLEVEPDEAMSRRAIDDGPGDGVAPVGAHCGRCTRCLDACPTGAFAAPGVVEARRCISYHTIENRGAIPRELRGRFGALVFGCDVCLEVCPWNRFAQAGRSALRHARDDLAGIGLGELLDLDEARFRELFRRSPVRRAKLRGLLRNACVAAGATGRRDLLPRLLALAAGHPEPLVRAHAVWAARVLAPGGEAEGRLAAARAAERDPGVVEEYRADV